jgi:enoyl-CoA hydratase
MEDRSLLRLELLAK